MGGKPVVLDESYIVEDRGYRTPCWIWTRAKNKGGYGQIWVKHPRPRLRSTHIVFYERKYGPVPEGMELDHLCEVKSCCNPDHVEPVTHAENVRRGRNTRLTVEQVQQIRESSGTQREIAKVFGVNQSLVSLIKSGKRWKGEGVDNQAHRHRGEAEGANRQAASGVG